MKPYPKYKDSGIEWLGKVPEGWKVRRSRNVINYKKGKNPSVLLENNVNNQYLPYLSMDYLRNNENEIYFVEKVKDTVIANDGDILLLWDGSNAGEFIVSKNGAVSSTMAKISPEKNLDKKFCFFLCKTIEPILRDHTIGMGIPHVNTNMLKNIACPLPAKSEQTTIASFLDHKTTKIDELIKKNERLIELLKEKRQAIISHAVTKGIPPHPPLEKGGWGNLKMKDSGIEWIGEISESWTLIPMKYVTYMKGRIGWQGLKQSEFTDEGPYLITGMNFKDGVIRWEEVYHITEERYNEAPEIHLKVGDVLMTKDGTIGKVLFVDVLPDRASLNSHLLVLRPLKDHFLPKYLYYLLHSDYFKDHIEINKTGTTFFGITQEAVGRYKILLPPTKEQENIVSFIDKETAKIDRIIIKIQSQIESLKEYRQALISNVVTGKVRVT